MAPVQSEIHARCGGTLRPEVQPRLSFTQSRAGRGRDVVTRGAEVLWRCGRCHLVGVLVEQVTAPALAEGDLTGGSPSA